MRRWHGAKLDFPVRVGFWASLSAASNRQRFFPQPPSYPTRPSPLSDGDGDLPLFPVAFHLRPPTTLPFPPPLQAAATTSNRCFSSSSGPLLPFLAWPPLPRCCRALAALLRATASISARLAREVIKITGYSTNILCSFVLDVIVFLGKCLGWK